MVTERFEFEGMRGVGSTAIDLLSLASAQWRWHAEFAATTNCMITPNPIKYGFLHSVLAQLSTHEVRNSIVKDMSRAEFKRFGAQEG